MARVTAATPEDHEGLQAAAQRNLEQARRALARAQAQLEETTRTVLRPPKTSVIRFAKKFANSSKVYEYAAIKTAGNGTWYTTSQDNSAQGLTWKQLAEFIAEDNTIPTAYVELDEADDNDLPF